MSQQPPSPEGPSGAASGEPPTQDVQFSPATARIPEKISRGVLSTGALVMQGAHEVVVDFLLWLAPPHHLAARIILPLTLMPSLLRALDDNLARYRSRFGPPPSPPPPPPGSTAPKVEELYARLKLPDDMLGGVYANGVMITHSVAEFCLDFIFNGYPRSVVVSRVYLSSFHVQRFVDALRRVHGQMVARQVGGPVMLPPGATPVNLPAGPADAPAGPAGPGASGGPSSPGGPDAPSGPGSPSPDPPPQLL